MYIRGLQVFKKGLRNTDARKELPQYILHHNWRGHQTSPTVLSLKGLRLQTKSTFPCEIVQIHSLVRHGFINKPKSKKLKQEIDVFYSYVTHFEK